MLESALLLLLSCLVVACAHSSDDGGRTSPSPGDGNGAGSAKGDEAGRIPPRGDPPGLELGDPTPGRGSARSSETDDVTGDGRGGIRGFGEPPGRHRALLQASRVEWVELSIREPSYEERLAMIDRLWPAAVPTGRLLKRTEAALDRWSPLEETDHPPELLELLHRAQPLALSGRFEEAEDILREAIALAPGSYLARVQLADAVGGQGRLEEALGHYRAARELNPVHYRSYATEASVQLARGELAEGLELFAWALALNPRDGAMRRNIAEELAPQGVALAPELVLPRGLAERVRGGEAVATTVAEGSPHWGAFATCKALWLASADHREACLGTREHPYSVAEEAECLSALLKAYEAQRRDVALAEDPALEALRAVFDAGAYRELILLELLSRVVPHLVMAMLRGEQQRLQEYVRDRVLLPDGTSGMAA